MMADTVQELGQTGISLIRKNQLKAKFEKMQKEVSALQKAKATADQKMVSSSAANDMVIVPELTYPDPR